MTGWESSLTNGCVSWQYVRFCCYATSGCSVWGVGGGERTCLGISCPGSQMPLLLRNCKI